MKTNINQPNLLWTFQYRKPMLISSTYSGYFNLENLC